uniref:Uncharacterized protein n=1 Tax=Romanomermis culicivorax TaxID=13658 RepID=A0A915IWH6_ROMCU
MVVASSTSVPPSSSSATPTPNTVAASVSVNGKPHVDDDKLATTAANLAAATVDQTILTTTQEENDLIGREFVRQYFTIFGTKPEAFHRFYNNDSQLIVNGSVYTGTTSIKSYVSGLNLHDCHTRIYQIAVTKPEAHSILVQILGEMSINRGVLRRFAQNVILSSFVKRKLYVAYDNFQYIDRAFSQICVSYGVETIEPYSENTSGVGDTKIGEDFRSVNESIEKSKITSSNPVVAASSSIMDAKAPPFIPSAQLNAPDQLQQQHQISSPSDNEEIGESIISDQKLTENGCSYIPASKMSPTLASESMISQHMAYPYPSKHCKLAFAVLITVIAKYEKERWVFVLRRRYLRFKQEFNIDESKLQPSGFNNLSYAGVAANSRLTAAAAANFTPMPSIPYGALNIQSQSTLVGVTPHGTPYLNQHNQIPHMAFVQENLALARISGCQVLFLNHQYDRNQQRLVSVIDIQRPKVKGIDLHDVNGVPIINSNSQMSVAAMNNGPCSATMYAPGGDVYSSGVMNNHRRNQGNMNYTNQKFERYRPSSFSNGRNASPRAGDSADPELQIFVRSIPRPDMRKELIDYFSQYGNVINVVIVAKDSPHNNYFAFITYENIASAKKALLYRDHVLDGNIRLEIEQRKHRSRFNNNYGGGGMMNDGHRMPQHGQHFSVGSGTKSYSNPRNVNPGRFNVSFSSMPHGGGSTGR